MGIQAFAFSSTVKAKRLFEERISEGLEMFTGEAKAQFVECPNDINGMIDAAKFADLALLLIDGSYGFEMETFEFLNILQNHGFPKIMGVLTHIDKFKDVKKLKKTKQRLKHRFWTMGSMLNTSKHVKCKKPAELAGSSGQQLGGVLQRKRSNDNLFPQNTALVDEQSSDLNQNSIRNVVERGFQASNLYLAKAWFHSSQPMTRSRSSELRRRYVSMQNSQTSLGVEAMHNVSGHGVNNLRQQFANPNGFGDVSMCEIPNHFNTFMSPSNSASSTFNAPHTDNIDKVFSVVSMLKGTLEHKKLSNETVEDISLELYGAQEAYIFV
ncbi:protein CYCLOPS-like [Camellia sinensis]|uniref:protein CYCLOPS-like n=1 Tax=Camellia sinensis TaxID=4442 RepID=UPI001035D786|nr:protein CYCLOPS-like [Camellia sinensis]